MGLPPNSESAPSSKSSNSRANNSASKFEFVFLTLFPEILEPIWNASLLGKAQASGRVAFRAVQIRDFSTDKHRTVDASPYGGGPGMLIRADVLYGAWASVALTPGGLRDPHTRTILMSPQGARFTQDKARALAGVGSEIVEKGTSPTGATPHRLIFVCGHYEGIDERFIDLCCDEELSLGDFIMTGGELAALAMTDAIARWIPGVVGNGESVTEDSLEGGLLKYPQYTRPREFQGLTVPDVLLSGDHAAIERWRQAERIERTRRKRPDLFAMLDPALGSKSGKTK